MVVMHRLQQSLGPSYTPKVIRALILVTTLTTLFAGLTDGIFRHWTGISFGSFLALSGTGIHQGFFWQLFTYPFIYTNGGGLSLAILIPLLFHMYLLWILGSSLVERFGSRPFLTLYLVTAFLAGIIVCFTGLAIHSSFFVSGATASILALLVAWSMLEPEMEFLLLLTIPVKAKWLIYGYLAITLLIDLSQVNLVDFFFTLSAAGFGYLFALYKWNLSSSFEFLSPLDRLFKPPQKTVYRDKNDKIVPLNPPRNDEDDHFLEEMLTKISTYGEQSLSPSERTRLNKISKSRNKN